MYGAVRVTLRSVGTLKPPFSFGLPKVASAPTSNGRPGGSGAPITAICSLVNSGGVWHSEQRATNERNTFRPSISRGLKASA